MEDEVANGRDVLWITLESVRQDRTSMGGHDRDTTPKLRRLADRDDAASFDRCFSHDIWTRSSTASILTGCAPCGHGTWTPETALRPSVPTIPELLSEHGYRTAAISQISQFSHATGLDRGFDDFHYLSMETLVEEVGIPRLLRFLATVRRHSAGLTTVKNKHCLGYLEQALAKRQIREAAAGDDPLFLYVHHGDSHHAYYPPRPWQSRFEDELELPLSDALDVSLDMSERIHEHVANGLPFDDAEWNAIEVCYDAAVAYVDQLAGDLAAFARDRLDDPIVVVTADHGELFGEAGCLAHMLTVNDAVSNVPLVVSGLDGTDGLDTDQLVQHADVMQMILSDLGVDVDLPAGRDIRERARGVAVTQHSGERLRHKLDVIADRNSSFDTSRYHQSDLTSVRTRRYRYSHSDDRSELFELPNEDDDVSDEHAEVVTSFGDLVEGWLDEHETDRSDAVHRAEFTEEMERQLEQLGYV